MLLCAGTVGMNPGDGKCQQHWRTIHKDLVLVIVDIVLEVKLVGVSCAVGHAALLHSTQHTHVSLVYRVLQSRKAAMTALLTGVSASARDRMAPSAFQTP